MRREHRESGERGGNRGNRGNRGSGEDGERTVGGLGRAGGLGSAGGMGLRRGGRAASDGHVRAARGPGVRRSVHAASGKRLGDAHPRLEGPLDLRLVPPALAAWATAASTLGASAELVGGLVVVCLLSAGVLLLVGRRRAAEDDGHRDGSGRANRSGSPLPVAGGPGPWSRSPPRCCVWQRLPRRPGCTAPTCGGGRCLHWHGSTPPSPQRWRSLPIPGEPGRESKAIT